MTTPVPRTRKVGYLDDEVDKLELVENFTIRVYDIDKKKYNLSKDEYIITCYKGYITDGSSIPKLFWRIYHPFYTEARWASAIHDIIYSEYYTLFPKNFADDLLKVMMIHDGANNFTASTFHLCVKLGGKGGWKNLKESTTHV